MLSVKEKSMLAEYVRENNLHRTNVMSKEVYPKEGIYTKYIKRILDIIVSLVVLIITCPVNICIGICTYFDVGQPIFFLQKRYGKNGKSFRIVKFRNMTNEKDADGNLLPMNQRVTNIGAFMRITSLDELLNFWSILKGDMSIIGPRPLAEVYWNRYSERHKARHLVRPGLECPNLFHGGHNNGWHEQFENDIWYVEHISFLTDCRMLLCLLKMVFDKKTRKEHAVKGIGDFMGYDENGHAFSANDIPQKYLDMIYEKRGR